MRPLLEHHTSRDLTAARVLIVDDEPSVRKVLTTLLLQAGVPCSGAADPREALTMLSKTNFAAVISDLRMGAASGLELLREVRAHYPELAFLMATGVDDVRVGVQAMKLGADDYLLKPFDIDVVLTSLHRTLERKQMENELERKPLSIRKQRTRFWTLPKKPGSKSVPIRRTLSSTRQSAVKDWGWHQPSFPRANDWRIEMNCHAH
jgi:DNA-binding NtrC family response regulator